MSEKYLPFKGLKVLELASVLAGPLAGSFFAELGAEVTKVENKKTGGEMTRGWRHPSESGNKETSDYYAAANASKEVIYLDLGEETDYKALTGYVSHSQIVISNFLPRVAEKLKCTFKDLLRYNNRLIMVNLVAYDSEDDRPGFDLLMQAECGYLAMTGTKDHLAKMPVAMIDVIASHQMKEAVLIGLYEQALGRITSAEYHVSLYQSGLTGLINQGSSYINSKILPQPIGTLHPTIAPYGDVFQSADGIDFTLAVGTDRQFEKLCAVIHLPMPEVFRMNANRVANRKDLFDFLNKAFLNTFYEQLDIAFILAGIPFSKINSVKETFENLLAQEMIIEVSDGKQRISDIAFKEINRT